MNEHLIRELTKRIQQLERRIEYLETETAEKNVFSTITVDTLSTIYGLNFTAAGKTISSGVIDVTDCSYIYVESEVTDSADNLDSITGGVSGQILILVARYPAETITVRDNSVGSGNIYTAGAASRTLNRDSSGTDSLMLIYYSPASQWIEVSYSDN